MRNKCVYITYYKLIFIVNAIAFRNFKRIHFNIYNYFRMSLSILVLVFSLKYLKGKFTDNSFNLMSRMGFNGC